MKKVDKVLWYHQEDLRKDIVKALFGENAVLCIDYVYFHYEDNNDAGLLVNFIDKDQPHLSKTFIIRIEDVTDKEVTKEEI